MVNNNTPIDPGSGPGSGLGFINLTPPDGKGDAYQNLAQLHGNRAGQTEDPSSTVSKILGFSSKDTIEFAEDIKEISSLANKFSIALQTGTPLNASDPLQVQLNSFDPSQPFVPVIPALIKISSEMLQKGDLGGIQVTVKENAEVDLHPNAYNIIDINNDTSVNFAGPVHQKAQDPQQQRNIPTNASATATTSGAGIWLAGNAYVGFLIAFMALTRELMQLKSVQGDIQVKSMALIKAFAEDTKQAILNTAYMQQAQHITAAVCAGVALTGTVIAGIGTVKSLAAEESPPSKESDAVYRESYADEAVANERQTLETEWETTKPYEGDSYNNFVKNKIGKPDANEQEIQEFRARNPEKDFKAEWKNAELRQVAKNKLEKDVLYNEHGLTEKQVEAFNIRQQKIAQTWQLISSGTQSGSTMINELVQAAYAVPIATQEAAKEILQSYRQIESHILDTLTDAFKSNTDLIAQLIQTLQQMRDQLSQAIAASLSAR